MKKPTKASLRQIGIVNPHDLAHLGPEPQVLLAYTTNDYSRGGHGASWRVGQIGFKTDPNAAWYDNGNKTFMVFTMTKHQALEAAQAWAAERYHITAWERSPWGSYHPAGTIAYAVMKKTAEKAGVG